MEMRVSESDHSGFIASSSEDPGAKPNLTSLLQTREHDTDGRLASAAVWPLLRAGGGEGGEKQRRLAVVDWMG
jgi:hypothetical protein